MTLRKLCVRERTVTANGKDEYDDLGKSHMVELALTIGALAIAAVVFFWLLDFLKDTFKAAFIVGFFLLGLWLAFGIGPSQVWETLQGWLPDFLTDPGN